MTTLSELPLRDDLRGRSAYGAPQDEVALALNVNENAFAVPDHVIADIVHRIERALATVNRYPDREFVELREAFVRYLGHGLTAENIWAANGSNEVLQHVLQAFGGPGRRVMGYAPTYSMYPLLSGGVGSEWVGAPRDPDFELSAETAVNGVARFHPDIVILCSPNNPTGTPVSLETISAVYDSTEGIVVVDEAYAEFLPDGEPSALSLLPGRPRLLVSRTMSKAFAFAGARLGYLAADPAVIDALRLVRLPYHLSALTQAAALGALAHTDDMLAMVDRIRRQRDRLLTELPDLGYSVSRSGANFVLFGGVPDSHETFMALREQGILIRDIGLPHYLRVTAGSEEETSLFLSALAGLGRPSSGALSR